MQICKDSVVTLDYRVTDVDGNVIDEGEEPLVYLHGGYGGIFGKVEETLEGKTAGDHFEVKLEPDNAFGEYDAKLAMIEPRMVFPESIEVGMQFERAGEEGFENQVFTVTEVAEDKVVVDGNHPLAGMALMFSCTVTEVRAAGDDEVAHGHAHRPGAAHHDH